MEPSLLIRPVGSSIRLSCDALGFPLPAIDWYKDGQKIDTAVLDDHMESGKWRFGSSNNGGNSEDGSMGESDMWSLPLVSLQEEDSGEYKCVVSNGHGEISHTYTLTVIGKLRLSHHKNVCVLVWLVLSCLWSQSISVTCSIPLS